MSKKYVFICAVLFLAITQAASAFELSTSRDTVNAPMGITEKVIVSVYSDISERIVFSMMDEKPWMLLQDSQLSVDAGQTKSTILYLSPKNVSLGQYRVRIIAQSENDKKTKDVYVSLTKGEGVHLDRIVVTGGLEPKGTVNFKFSAINFDSTEYQDVLLTMIISSPSGKFAEINDIFTVGPDSRKLFDKDLYLKEGAEAGNYKADIKIVHFNKELDSATQGFIVVEKSIIEKETVPFYTGFGYGKTIKVRNTGNAEQPVYTIQQHISNFEGMFFSGTRPASIMNDIYSWEIKNLGAGSEITIMYRIDYSPLVIFLAVAMVVAWIYLKKYRTIRLRKYIMQKKTIEEGTEFTIGVDIRNAGSRASNIIIRDFVPSAFNVKDTEGIKPAKKKRESGTELTWKMSDMNHNEERVVSYRIVPVFSVQGQIILPAASAKFTASKKENESTSDTARIGLETKERLPTLDDVFRKK